MTTTDKLTDEQLEGMVQEGDAAPWVSEMARELLDHRRASQAAPAPSDALREALIRDVYEAAWEMDEAFGVREDSFQMAASEKLCSALVALREEMPEVDQDRAALSTPTEERQ